MPGHARARREGCRCYRVEGRGSDSSRLFGIVPAPLTLHLRPRSPASQTGLLRIVRLPAPYLPSRRLPSFPRRRRRPSQPQAAVPPPPCYCGSVCPVCSTHVATAAGCRRSAARSRAPPRRKASEGGTHSPLLRRPARSGRHPRHSPRRLAPSRSSRRWKCGGIPPMATSGGFQGVAPPKLALALLLDHTGDSVMAQFHAAANASAWRRAELLARICAVLLFAPDGTEADAAPRKSGAQAVPQRRGGTPAPSEAAGGAEATGAPVPGAIPDRCPVVGKPVCYYADCRYWQGERCAHPEAVSKPGRRRAAQ